MDLGLANRVALVTGAAGGIGAAIAGALAADGCELALIDHAAIDTARYPKPPLTLTANVSDWSRANEVVRETVDRLGSLDILVCSAGITRDAVSWKLSESDWDDVLAVNLKGCFTYARAAIPVMRQRGGGRIVNIGSINGLRGKFGQANYAASKAGLIGMSKSLAREAGRFGVTVNVVAPGLVETTMTRALPEPVRAAAQAESALAGATRAEDIAAAVVFLCSKQAGRITGEVLRVDAGQYI